MGFIAFIVWKKKADTFTRRNKLFLGPSHGEEFVMRFYIRRSIEQYNRWCPGTGTKHGKPAANYKKTSMHNCASGAHKSKPHWAYDAVADTPSPWRFSLWPGTPPHAHPNQYCHDFKNLSSPNSYSPLSSLGFSWDLPDVIKAISCNKHEAEKLMVRGLWESLLPR